MRERDAFEREMGNLLYDIAAPVRSGQGSDKWPKLFPNAKRNAAEARDGSIRKMMIEVITLNARIIPTNVHSAALPSSSTRTV